MFRHLLSILSLLCMIVSPAVADLASVSHVNEMRDNVQAKIDNKAQNDNYTQNMVLQTDSSGNVVATTVGTDLLADGAIETMHLADGAVTNADLAGMIDITKLNLGTLPTSGKHIMIWNATTNEYVFERYATSILPDGYTRLEYIESTGTQYIDTGIYWKSGYSSEMDFTSISAERNLCLWGASNGSAYNNGEVSVFWYDGRFDRVMPTSNSISVNGVFEPYDANTRYLLIYNNKSTTAISDMGVISISNQGFYDSYVGERSIHIMATHRTGAEYNSSIKLHNFKIFDNTITMVRNFIPAKNSSGVIGMYDTVTKTFFTNAGTGNFIAGPEI